MTERPAHITLAVFPDRKGFGWVAFTGPFAVFDWGLAVARRDKNAVCLAKIEALQQEKLFLVSALEAQRKLVEHCQQTTSPQIQVTAA